MTRDHRRQWRSCLYVYPVIARRSKGLSIGVNLNPDKRCTFSCVYCQIDRRAARELHTVDLAVLRDELCLAMEEAITGRLWEEKRFAPTPPELRRINDIAFSGDGEPTCLGEFHQAVRIAAEVKRKFGRGEVKIVVITNATQLQSPQVRRALPVLDANNGEIWAKLDAGTEEYFRKINRPNPPVTLASIVRNIVAVARDSPVVIQTLLFKTDGRPPPPEELDAYCARLREILDAGGKIKLVQLHTIARPPAEGSAIALGDGELDALADRIRASLPELNVEAYYGTPYQPPMAIGGEQY